MVFAGHLDVYERAPEMIEKFLRIATNTAQVFRVTNRYGEAIEPALHTPTEALPVGSGEVVYAEVDGSMIFTDEQWREVKLGRVFRSEDIGQPGATMSGSQRSSKASNTRRGREILHSEYTAHLGGHGEFREKFAVSIEKYRCLGDRLVFLRDGSLWMEQWIAREYPLATQILDFYHAAEHLGEFARIAIPDARERVGWQSHQKALLLSGKVLEVLENVKSYGSVGGVVAEQGKKLEGYYWSNREYMRYGEYIQRGLEIGSGAIESAHRTVVQRRMKLSGQRWANSGAQNVLNLRAASMSQRWNLVIERIKHPTLTTPQII
jgi:hypothetical protein